MIMHGLFVAEVADLGQLRMLTHTGWPRSATRGYSGANIRGIRGFGTKNRVFA